MRDASSPFEVAAIFRTFVISLLRSLLFYITHPPYCVTTITRHHSCFVLGRYISRHITPDVDKNSIDVP